MAKEVDNSIPEESALHFQKDDSGNTLSPVLGADRRNFLIDIDGTICDDVPNEEPERMTTVLPFEGALEFVNGIYDQGHVVTFFTSRTEDLRVITEAWLQKHGFRYHGMLMGKPRGGNYHWIDNHVVRATRFYGKFSALVPTSEMTEKFEE
ncbi:MAG TPA: phosphoheptose isomerase [Saprospiraceae bacterium]|nr:phosphoheptose isomerase [Saprospiraceae bacterium]HMZ40045.1 phosphoheptose isomerase [Saprospiraceae bacterium]HNA65542.1 phosphoheptose isomerase [Saprospiraceae bacterium]HNB31109.1 phosphoheptose isomerase [Saprospiraceae bacterium]HNC35429.1 phosphoheptose isomerase [Saprospiraceae bacterium]